MFMSRQEYDNCLDLLEGRRQKSPLLNELADWAKCELDIDVIDYVCDYAISGQIRLRIVVWDNDDYSKFFKGINYDSRVQKKFQNEFADLAKKYQKHIPYHSADKIFVCCGKIKDEIQEMVLKNAKNEILALQSGDIWKIVVTFGAIHIFYETDKQVKEHEIDGVSEAFRQKCAEIIKKYDFFNTFSKCEACVFTSRQTLNEKYEGNMYYYFK